MFTIFTNLYEHIKSAHGRTTGTQFNILSTALLSFNINNTCTIACVRTYYIHHYTCSAEETSILQVFLINLKSCKIGNKDVVIVTNWM